MASLERVRGALSTMREREQGDSLKEHHIQSFSCIYVSFIGDLN